MRRLAAKRTSYSHRDSIDWGTSTAIRGALTEEQESDLLCIQGGGLWTAHTLRAAGLLDSGTCPWCGREEETLEHLWWRCEAFSGARQKVTRDLRVDLSRLPKSLALHGLAPEMAAVHSMRSSALLELNRCVAALEASTVACELEPGNAGLVSQRAACLLNVGEADAAMGLMLPLASQPGAASSMIGGTALIWMLS
jgi:hypothetical protein